MLVPENAPDDVKQAAQDAVIDTPYFFRRNRDLGTISVYMGYRDVRCLPPTCTYMVRTYMLSAN